MKRKTQTEQAEAQNRQEPTTPALEALGQDAGGRAENRAGLCVWAVSQQAQDGMSIDEMDRRIAEFVPPLRPLSMAELETALTNAAIIGEMAKYDLSYKKEGNNERA